MIAPLIDPRDASSVLAGLVQKLPGYTPGLTPAGRGAALALLRVIARYRHILNQGINRAPDRALLAFLDTIGVHLAPASPARVPLVFTLAEDARLDVTLPAGSQVAAPPAPDAPAPNPDDGPAPESVVFATERTVTLCRSRLTRVYSIEPGADRYAEHSGQLLQGFTLFGDLVQTEHALYLGHDTLFAFGGDITLIMGVSLDRGAAAPVDLRWEYLSDAGWIPLESPLEQDTTSRLMGSGQFALRRECGPDAKRATFAGRTSFWLRGVSRSAVIPGMGALPLVVNDLNARVKFRKSGLAPESAFADFVKLDVTKHFFPFSEQPATFSTFYLASKEVFQRGGAKVQITFDASVAAGITPDSSLVLAWEYSTADGWSMLDVQPAPGAIGSQSAAAYVFRQTGTVSFTCPHDWAEASVNGDTKLWLRIRIVQGKYGNPITANAATSALVASTLAPPVVSRVALSFEYLTDPVALDHCLSLNDFVFDDQSEACRWPDRSFAPFHAVADASPAVHLGFDKPLPVGLISLYVEVPEAGATSQAASPYVWEYRNADGWADLSVLDDTCGFRQSGMLQFIGPRDLAASDGLGGNLYRLHARLKQGETMALAPVAGVWLNAVWGVHHRRIEGELLGVSDGSPGQSLRFVYAPVLAGETIEVREWTGRGEAWRTALENVPESDLRFERDPATRQVTAVWVRWHERPHLHDSSATDRHYVIERATGVLRFGAGVPAAGKRIVAKYATGGGAAGNVPVGTVRELRVAIPFIAGVDNPVAALGGAAAESTAEVRRRGPQSVRHRGRALSAQDYEWLARDTSPEVARTRCEPLLGPDGKAQRGWVTILVAPKSAAPQPAPNGELARRIRQHVAEHAPAGVALRIEAPDYLPVSVLATLTPDDPSEAALVEARVREALNRFLHPLNGGPDGHGWKFGQALHLSQVAAVIERTPGVDYAASIVLECRDAICDAVVTVPANALIAAGSHELTLRVGGH